jgi:acetylornithine deacetylase/succinyl-diaminopimelate desuccinylase-like protein
MMDDASWAQARQEALVEVIDQLCRIPAPSHKEHKRAAFIRDWLIRRGIGFVTVDEAQNVIIFPRGEPQGKITLIMAHTDTVFPDEEPYVPEYLDGRLYCPGAGDDTANVAALMLLAEYVAQSPVTGGESLVFAANSCEEGLGNLKGCRALMARFSGRLRRVLSLDGTYDNACNRAVGSSRYEVTVTTEGGHSFSNFGNRNAIHALSVLIAGLYAVKPPVIENSRTTYNVGGVQGGTSVNTIAQQASMLYEYRSDHPDGLAFMQRAFLAQLEALKAAGVDVTVRCLGERPSMGQVDPLAQSALEDLCLASVEEITGHRIPLRSGSTDINLPLSMGIPALCFGAYRGAGAHTQEEWIDLASLTQGLAIWKRVTDRLLRPIHP